MVAGFSVLSLALDAQTDIVTTQRMVSDIEIKKQQETFGILASVDGNNLLDVIVNNQGQNPVEISSIWITNKTLSDQPATRYDINYDDAFVPSGFTSDVVSTQTLEIIPNAYDIKVISSLGTIKTVELVVGAGASTSGLRAELITDPPDVIIGQNVTIAMIVTNTGEAIIQNVEPDPLSLGGAGSVIASTSHTPSSVNLNRGESVMFSWDYQVTGDSGDDLNFSTIARGDFASPDDVWTSVVSDTSILRLPTDGGESTSELIVLTQDLLAKPEIFIAMPGPFGESSQKGLWGVTVVNPIDKDFEVSKIVISTTSTRYTGGDEIFSDDNNLCEPEHVNSTLGGTWTCPIPNQLVWKNILNPVTVPGLSSVEFLARVIPGKIQSSGTFLETVPVNVSLFSTLGQFGKSGYSTSFHDSRTSIANVYLTDLPGSTNNDNISTSVNGITSGSVVKLNVTLADFDTLVGFYIQDTNSRLIINIPKGWSNPSIINPAGFTIGPISTFSDGSSQIIGILNSDITGVSDAQTIEFQVTAPDVTSTQLYVMYVLADGLSTTGGSESATVGPLSEVVLQVVPP